MPLTQKTGDQRAALNTAIDGHVDVISLTEVRGWVIDWDRPKAKLEIAIIVNGIEIGTCRTDIERPGLKQALGRGASGIHEFQYLFNPPLDNREHHQVEVLTVVNHVLLPNGRCALYRPTSGQSNLTPILLTSNGRSGTTMIMQEFATHPDIAVANVYPFELKLSAYYSAAWHVLTQSTFTPTGDELDFAARATRDLLIGRNPWNRPDLWRSVGGAPVAELIGRTVPDRLAQFFSSIIEESYAVIAAGNGKLARFFAEKSVLEEPVRVAYRVLFPNVKEIVLVRDPRDYLCSARTFWKHGAREVIATQASELPILSKIYNENRGDVRFVRYEDLVLDPVATRRKIYEFIGCDPDFRPHCVAADVVPVTHRTSASATASIGRFKTELDEATLCHCNEAFGPFLALFDYTQ